MHNFFYEFVNKLYEGILIRERPKPNAPRNFFVCILKFIYFKFRNRQTLPIGLYDLTMSQ